MVATERRRGTFLTTWLVPAATGMATVISTAVMIGISVGGARQELQQQGVRIQAVEAAVERARSEADAGRKDQANDRKELKADMQREVQNLQNAVNLLDQKLTTAIANRAFQH